MCVPEFSMSPDLLGPNLYIPCCCPWMSLLDDAGKLWSSSIVVAMDHSRADGLNNQIYKGEKQWLHQHQTRACFCNMLCMMCFKMLFMLIIFFPVWKFDYYLHITWSSLCYYIYHYQSWKRQKNIFQIFFIWKNLFSVIIPLLASMQMWSRSTKYIHIHMYLSRWLLICAIWAW